MYVPEVHDYSEVDTKEVKEFIAQERRKQIKDVIEQLVDDEFDRLVEYANDHISEVAADRAEKFLRKVLAGDDDAAMALLGNRNGHDRVRGTGSEEGKPWAELMHGTLFETGGIKLRRQIAEANADLLKSERIADLESVVEGLTQQIGKLERELYQCHERLR